MRDGSGVLPGVGDLGDDGVHANSVTDLGKNNRAVAAHGAGVALHDLEIGADGRGKVGLVDDQQIGLSNAGSALAGNLVAGGHVNDVDGIVGEFAAEMGGEVVPARFYEQHFSPEAAMEVFKRQQIRRNVFPNRCVRTASGFDGADAFGVQGMMTDKKFTVFASKDVIGNRGEADSIAQFLTKSEHEGGFATADRAADSDGERALGEVAGKWLVAFMKVAGVGEVVVGVAVSTVRVMMGERHWK